MNPSKKSTNIFCTLYHNTHLEDKKEKKKEVWLTTVSVVVAAVGTYVDDFQRIKGIVIRMNKVFLETILDNLLIQVLHE